MADIISSPNAEQRVLMETFKRLISKVNNEYQRGQLISPLTITLGDEFQGIPKTFNCALGIIFRLDHLLLQTDIKLRYTLCYGRIDTEINTKVAYEMLGEGLTSARNSLNNLKKSKSRIEVFGIEQKKANRINWALKLYQLIYDGWKAKDRLIAYELIINDNYSQVAPLFGRDPSSMWRKRETLKIDEYSIAKDLIHSLADE